LDSYVCGLPGCGLFYFSGLAGDCTVNEKKDQWELCFVSSSCRNMVRCAVIFFSCFSAFFMVKRKAVFPRKTPGLTKDKDKGFYREEREG